MRQIFWHSQSLDCPRRHAQLPKSIALPGSGPEATIHTSRRFYQRPCLHAQRRWSCAPHNTGSVGLHNVDGLRWFLEQVWPTIVERLPAATLHVCGSVCEEVRERAKGVVYRGEIPNLDGEYAKAALVIVPLRSGSGLKIKTIEAMSHGRARVTTSIGAQGLARGDKAPFLVADDAVDFAAAVIKLLRDDDARHEVSAKARQGRSPYTAAAASAPLRERGL